MSAVKFITTNLTNEYELRAKLFRPIFDIVDVLKGSRLAGLTRSLESSIGLLSPTRVDFRKLGIPDFYIEVLADEAGVSFFRHVLPYENYIKVVSFSEAIEILTGILANILADLD